MRRICRCAPSADKEHCCLGSPADGHNFRLRRRSGEVAAPAPCCGLLASQVRLSIPAASQIVGSLRVTYNRNLVRPAGIEPALEASEAPVISISPRARLSHPACAGRITGPHIHYSQSRPSAICVFSPAPPAAFRKPSYRRALPRRPGRNPCGRRRSRLFPRPRTWRWRKRRP